jgi:LL-diaminopimelate aminotransferase
MNIQFASRMDSFQPGIFNVMDEKKKELLAQGRKVYNLSVGTPDFEPGAHVVDALVEAAKDPKNFRYSLGDLPELIQAVQGWYARRYGVELAEDEIMSVYGSQEGLTHIGLTLCDPGDLVLVPDPGYPIFEIGPFLCGAKIGYYPLVEENNFLPDLDAIPEETARACKMMVVSYPANPIGKTAPRSFYEKLIAFAQRYDIVILHDNAYSEIIYDGREGISFLSIPGAKEVGVEYNSLSKTYNLTGARVSFVLGNRDIVAKFKTLRSQIDYGIFLPIQYAAIAALNGPQEGVEAQRLGYQARRDALCGGFREIGWNVPDSEGSMFVWAKIPEAWQGDDVKFAFDLLEQTGLICTPGSAFGPQGKGHIRMALVLPPEEIQKAIQAVEESGILSK